MPSEYATDLLLRAEPKGAVPTAVPPSDLGLTRDDQALRAEAGRIFAAAIRNQALSERDRDYLVRVVQTRTGLPEAEARQRVEAATNEARDLEIKIREQADKARKAAVVTGFITAGSLLIGLVVACFTAGVGGRHRDQNLSPHYFGHRFW